MKWMRGYGTKLVWNLGFRVPSSNHPNIQTPNKSTKIRGDTTTRYNKTLRQDSMCFGPRNSVMSTFNAPSKPRDRNKSPKNNS